MVYIPYCFNVKTLAIVHEPIAIHIAYNTLPVSYITQRKALQCGVITRNGVAINPYNVNGAQK